VNVQVVEHEVNPPRISPRVQTAIERPKGAGEAAKELIQAGQGQRDRERLASKKLTLRQKGRLKCARAKACASALVS
jgi:hypothetical protein